MLATKNRIHGLLEATGLFEERQLDGLLAEARENRTPICATLVARSGTKEEQLLGKLAEAMELPFQRLKDVEVENSVLERIPTKAVFQYNIIPLSEGEDGLKVATSDPFTPGFLRRNEVLIPVADKPAA